MRHRVRGRQLSVDSEHRRALRRNLVQSLFLHGFIRTTLPKAKEVRPMAEKLITMARRAKAVADKAASGGEAGAAKSAAIVGHLKRRVAAILGWHRTPLKVRARRKRYGDEPLSEHDGVIKKLFGEIAEQFADRQGGYTRILQLGEWRLGDGGRICRFELLPKGSERRGATPSTAKRARHRRRDGLETQRKRRDQARVDERTRVAAKQAAREKAESAGTAAATAAATATAEAPSSAPEAPKNS